MSGNQTCHSDGTLRKSGFTFITFGVFFPFYFKIIKEAILKKKQLCQPRYCPFNTVQSVFNNAFVPGHVNFFFTMKTATIL